MTRTDCCFTRVWIFKRNIFIYPLALARALCGDDKMKIVRTRPFVSARILPFFLSLFSTCCTFYILQFFNCKSAHFAPNVYFSRASAFAKCITVNQIDWMENALYCSQITYLSDFFFFRWANQAHMWGRGLVDLYMHFANDDDATKRDEWILIQIFPSTMTLCSHTPRARTNEIQLYFIESALLSVCIYRGERERWGSSSGKNCWTIQLLHFSLYTRSIKFV